ERGRRSDRVAQRPDREHPERPEPDRRRHQPEHTRARRRVDVQYHERRLHAAESRRAEPADGKQDPGEREDRKIRGHREESHEHRRAAEKEGRRRDRQLAGGDEPGAAERAPRLRPGQPPDHGRRGAADLLAPGGKDGRVGKA
ncbi:MAG: hypothetical protein ACK559_00710, partial [bacterium]